MQSTAKIVIALAVAVVASPANSASSALHGVKHHGRHLHAHHRARAQPSILVPVERPAYGGPLYSTCDRINADPMLVGTCR